MFYGEDRMCTEYSSVWDADFQTVVDTLRVPCQWSPAIHSRYHTGSTEAQAYLSLLNRLTSRRTFRCLLVLAPNYMTPFASTLAHCLGNPAVGHGIWTKPRFDCQLVRHKPRFVAQRG